MRLMIIHDNITPDYSSTSLMKAARELGHEIRYIRISHLDLIVGEEILVKYEDSEEITEKYEGGVIRSFGFTINLTQFLRRITVLWALEAKGITLMNPLKSLLISRNKLLSLVLMRKQGIRVPETFSSESLRSSYKAAHSHKVSVIKPIMGSRGYGISLAPNPDVAFLILKALISNKQPPIIQRFLRSKGYDIRLFVVGDLVLGAMKRISEKCWKTNIAQGGKGEAFEPDSELEKLAIKATKALGLWYAGVDVMEEDGKYYVLEVNGSPEWRELERVTGVNPAYEIIKYLESKIFEMHSM